MAVQLVLLVAVSPLLANATCFNVVGSVRIGFCVLFRLACDSTLEESLVRCCRVVSLPLLVSFVLSAPGTPW